MYNKVRDFIKLNINIDKPVVCATSGGVDSVVLIHILHDLGYKVILAHVNHHKRAESEIEEVKMKELANSLNIPFELLSYHYDGENNFHDDSHNARYNFFRGVADKYNTDIIATAHHADDQIETILIKLLEGSNLYGYGGISIVNNDGNYRIVRPLLCVTKEDIYNYAKANNYEWFEDSSNQADDFLRNRLRHHVVPLLKDECSDLANKVLEYSIMVHESFDYIRNLSKDYLNKNNNKINYESFNNLDIALKKDIITLLLERYEIIKNNNVILNILNISGNGTKTIDLNNNYQFIKSYNEGYIIKKEQININPVSLDLNNYIIYNNKYKFYFSKIVPNNNAKYIRLCYNNLELPFTIRPKNDGDIIKIKAGTKKVSRVFIDKKIKKEERDYVPIILDNNGEVIWIYDYLKSYNISANKDLADIYLVCEQI